MCKHNLLSTGSSLCDESVIRCRHATIITKGGTNNVICHGINNCEEHSEVAAVKKLESVLQPKVDKVS